MKKVVLMVTALSAMGLARAAMLPVTGTNAVGYVSVAAPANANSIITVPFEACLGDGGAGMLADLVATNGLTADASDAASADQLVVLTTNGTSLVYYYYWLKSGQGWQEISTAQIMPDGSTATLTPPAATNFPVARGLGFWIKRVAGGTSSMYVKGQISSEKQSTLIQSGLNLVGIASVKAFTLNDSGIDWTGAYGGTGNTSTSDKILVVESDGTFTEYFYFVKPAGWSADYNALNNKWITKSYTLAAATIPAGRGFWYLRRGTGSLTFKPDGE